MRFSDTFIGCRYFSYSPDLAKIFGIKASIFLAFLQWKLRSIDDSVELTMAEIEDQTGLSSDEQRSARNSLGEILCLKRARIQHRTFYSLNQDALDAKMDAEFARRPISPSRKSPSRI